MAPHTDSRFGRSPRVVSPEARVYRLAAICGLLVVAAVIVPRFMGNPEGGFAIGATAVLGFLLILGVALATALYLLVVTLRSYRDLPTPARVVGVGPSVVLAGTLFGLIGWLAY
jgi:hypothetical protein